MYNLRSRTRKYGCSPEEIMYHYSSGDMSDKFVKINLNRVPLLEDPSNHKCLFEVCNGKATIKKEEDARYGEKIIHLILICGLVFSVMLAIHYRDECKTYTNYLGRSLVLFPNKFRSFNTKYLASYTRKWTEVFRKKEYSSSLKKQLPMRSDVCYNDIRHFIKEQWTTVEKRADGAVSFIEEQCRIVKLLPKSADHTQFSFNDTATARDMDVFSLTDYASYDKGARILSTSGAEPYVEYKIQSAILQYILGIKYFNIDELAICRISETLCRTFPAFVTGPFSILQPWNKPGECWSFKGTRGRVQIELADRIFITAVTLEHVPAGFASTSNLRSAPAYFSLIGIDTEGYKFTSRSYLGRYMYLLNEPNIQTFFLSKEDSSNAYNIIELNIESNHGNENYTCVYRFRVHGKPMNSVQK